MAIFMEPVIEKKTTSPAIGPGNNLFPVFIKLEKLRLLIVGGGKIGLEKLQVVLLNSPATEIVIVATEISVAVRELAALHHGVRLVERRYHPDDLENADI